MLNSTMYEVMPHPAAARVAYGQEGRKAVVYQLRGGSEYLALKVFKRQFRDPSLVDICRTLARLDFVGLEVCNRTCLTRDYAPLLLREFPDLEYAVLMPWIQGSTWFDIVIQKTAIDQDTSKKLASNLADVLAGLEGCGFAHCDVAGANVIVNTTIWTASLIDIEDMFGPGLLLYGGFPQGTTGYQHPASCNRRRGQWCVEGDRFSGAVLLAETLAWHNPEIREAADDEHFFAEEELQDPSSPRYQLMLDTLTAFSPQVAHGFRLAWKSATLTECPSLREWARLLSLNKSLQRHRSVETPIWSSLPYCHQTHDPNYVTIEFRWRPVQSAGAYQLRYINSPGGEQLSTVPGSQSWVTLGVPEGTYDLYVRAVDHRGGLSNWSTLMRVTVYRRGSQLKANVVTV